jgi:hypothetical protein
VLKQRRRPGGALRMRSTPATEIGTVEVPDPETAIKEAIRRYSVTEP